MELKQFLSEDAIYKKVEEEITDWVEKAYEGLSIDFYPRLEVVQIDKSKKFTKPRVRKITEAVNIKIGELLEKHAEEIYIAERLERIYKNHPRFTLDVEKIEDIKTNPKFLQYLNELVIRE